MSLAPTIAHTGGHALSNTRGGTSGTPLWGVVPHVPLPRYARPDIVGHCPVCPACPARQICIARACVDVLDSCEAREGEAI